MTMTSCLQRAGVDVENLVMCQPDSGEMALEVVDQLVRSSSLDIIAIDSVAALTPRAEIEGEIGNVTRSFLLLQQLAYCKPEE